MNQVSIVGRLAQDPKFTQGEDTARAFFTVAVDRRGSAGGTDWIGVTAFGGLAETVTNYIGQGHLVAVEGHLRSSRYERNGETQYGLEVIANRVDFLARPRSAVGAEGDQAT